MIDFSLKNFKFLCDQNNLLQEKIKQEEKQLSEQQKEIERLKNEISLKNKQLYKQEFEIKDYQSRDQIQREELQKLRENLKKCSCMLTNISNYDAQINNNISLQKNDFTGDSQKANQAQKYSQQIKSTSIQLFDTNALDQKMEGPSSKLNNNLINRQGQLLNSKENDFTNFQLENAKSQNNSQQNKGLGVNEQSLAGIDFQFSQQNNQSLNLSTQQNYQLNFKINEAPPSALNLNEINIPKFNESLSQNQINKDIKNEYGDIKINLNTNKSQYEKQQNYLKEPKIQEQNDNSEQLIQYQQIQPPNNTAKSMLYNIQQEVSKKGNTLSAAVPQIKNNQQTTVCPPPSLKNQNAHSRSGSFYQGSTHNPHQSLSFHINSNAVNGNNQQQSAYSNLTLLKQTLYSNQNPSQSRKSSIQNIQTKKAGENNTVANSQDSAQQLSSQNTIQAKRNASSYSGSSTVSQSLTTSINGSSSIQNISSGNHFKNQYKIKYKDQSQTNLNSLQNTSSAINCNKENFNNASIQNQQHQQQQQQQQQSKKQYPQVYQNQQQTQQINDSNAQKTLKYVNQSKSNFTHTINLEQQNCQQEEPVNNALSSKSRGKSQTNFSTLYNKEIAEQQGKQLGVKQVSINSGSGTPASVPRGNINHNKTSSLTISTQNTSFMQQNSKPISNQQKQNSINIVLNTEPPQINFNQISFKSDRLMTHTSNNTFSPFAATSQTLKDLAKVRMESQQTNEDQKIYLKEGDKSLSQTDENEIERQKDFQQDKKISQTNKNLNIQGQNKQFIEDIEDFNIQDDTDEQKDDKLRFTHINTDKQKATLLTYFSQQDESLQIHSNSTINDIPKERTLREENNTKNGDLSGRDSKFNDFLGQKFKIQSEIKKEEPINHPHNNNQTIQSKNNNNNNDIVQPSSITFLTTNYGKISKNAYFVKSPQKEFNQTQTQNYKTQNSNNIVNGEENYLTQAEGQAIINCNYFSKNIKEESITNESNYANFYSNFSQINYETVKEIRFSQKVSTFSSPIKQQTPNQVNKIVKQENNNFEQSNVPQIQSPNQQNLELKVKSKSSGNLGKEPGRIKQNLESTNFQKLNPCPSSIISQTSSSNTQPSQIYKITPTLSYTKSVPAVQNKQVQQQDQLGQKIFEQFAIYGIDKTELDLKQPGIQFLQPKLQYRYPDKQILDNSRENTLPFFAFPKGVETQRFKMTDSLSQINEIMFANYVVEYNENCFTFVVKTDDSFKKQSHFQNSNKLLDICNPSKLLYGICFKIKDIVEDDSKGNDNSAKTLANSQNFWITKRAICFLTYYPFVKFFLDIISSLLNQIKMERINFYTQNHEGIKKDSRLLAKIEQQYFMKLIQNQFYGLLEELKNLSTPSINSSIYLSYKQERFMYYVPGQQSAKYIEAEGSSSIVFSCIAYETFIEIFFNILIEQPMVFVSANPALLSSVILMFYSLIKPFKWPHPLISILPQNLIHLLDSPIPIFLGLNMSKQEVLEKNLCEKHEQCTFVFLDDYLVEISQYTSENKELIHNSVLYNKLLSQTTKLYNSILPENLRRNQINYQIFQNNFQQNLNLQDKKKTAKSTVNLINVQSNDLKISKNNGLTTSGSNGQMTLSSSTSDLTTSNNINQIIPMKKELLISPNENQKQACTSLMMSISQFIQSEILDHLPHKKLVARGDVIDLELLEQYITCQRRMKDDLVSRIIKTQMFSFFVEEHYYENNF
ncbi:DENN (AEX-3) domain protein (macronuclear) [Tetrahymena thermophila SB210]|uniref:DENN (AEX-3) domain protein n=1 Tax=Tetrahymena thermophila (strain SB210) TaxID=312017 RepID=I7MMP7_TETTS|nr:DENN (AEX-3) domain protein [Tetrahymena thermophila SB210]EAS06158.1 DENN (AEX-3) domain protein [Tetrahymena thermophila SB210]|eukprot:XP_001026403.1 DENN (AEX-3) domain protein [Tetrahymena thermophila SB210]